MCNLGEDFYLGQKRNEVLKECNKILDVEDFWFNINSTQIIWIKSIITFNEDLHLF